METRGNNGWMLQDIRANGLTTEDAENRRKWSRVNRKVDSDKKNSPGPGLMPGRRRNLSRSFNNADNNSASFIRKSNALFNSIPLSSVC